MDDMALPFTHHLRLQVLFEEKIRQRHTQHCGDAFECVQGRHSLAVLELTDKARGDPGTLGEFNGSQSPCLAHTSKLFPQIHWPSLTLLVAPGEPGPLRTA